MSEKIQESGVRGQETKVRDQMSDKEKVKLLAQKVVFALKHMNTKGSGAVMKPTEDGGFTIISWVTDFCDALEACGYVVDRDALDRFRHPKKKKTSSLQPKT